MNNHLVGLSCLYIGHAFSHEGGIIMLSTLTPSEQILAIHQRLQMQRKAVVAVYFPKLNRTPKLLIAEKNIPEFHQRLPKNVNARFDLIKESSKREGTLISRHAYRVLRQFQMERILTSPIERNHPRPTNVLIDNQSTLGKVLRLKYPVLIGANGELVAMMRTDKQQLGEGNYGRVFVGMDLDTHKFIALKYHDLNNSKSKHIRQENAVMDDIGRLVTSFETEDIIITADELAWGSDYSQVMIDRADKPLDTKEIIYRLNMAIKFFEQVKSFNDKGFLNCDVKLDNMMWDPVTETATMIDFGFAKKAFSIKGAKVNGTPIYMAPEVEIGTYSLASDAYACGVALVEMFSMKDIFDHVEEWKLAYENYYNNNDPNVLINFFKMAAPDLLDNPLPSKMLTPIIHIIRLLINPLSDKRSSLEAAITALKAHYEMLTFLNFKVNYLQANDSHEPYQVTPEDMKNDRTREYLYQEVSDRRKFKNIHPDSLLFILQSAITHRNVVVYKNIIKHASLFGEQHHAYAQMLLKQALKVFKVQEEEGVASMDEIAQKTSQMTFSPKLRRSERLGAKQGLQDKESVRDEKRIKNTHHF